MTTAIIYMSQHGFTARTAHQLQALLPGTVEIINLYQYPDPDLSPFDTVIIGGSIHFGHIQKGLQRFCRQHQGELMYKNLGLFICCMEKGETARREFEHAFDEPLRRHATATGIFGGEFALERMSSFEKKLIRKIAGVRESISNIDMEEIRRFADAMLRNAIS